MGEQFVVENSSSLFPEIWSMHVAFMSAVATVCIPAQQASAGRVMAMVVQRVEELVRYEQKDGPTTPTEPLKIQATINGFPDTLEIPGQDGELLVVRGAQALFEKISLPAQEVPSVLSFELLPSGAPLASAEYEKSISHSHNLPNRYLADLWGYQIAGAYERMASAIKERFTADVRRWPPALQIFHHVRNAAFHAGRFDIWKNRNKIDYGSPPAWRGYTISSEEAVAGRYAIIDFLSMHHVLPFMHDISLELDGAGR
jgi:hypothetical protein